MVRINWGDEVGYERKPDCMPVLYRRLLAELMDRGVEETNARTGVKIKLLQGGQSFRLDMTNGLLPVPGNRRYFPRVAAAEVAWQLMGTQDPTFIVDKAPRLWEKFIEDGKLKTAYGWRWRHAFGRDQLELLVRALRDDPTNRQLYVSAWDPGSDGLGGPQPKNVPCPVGFSVSRFGDDLHMSVFLRSSDVFVGLPYDVMGYALTLDAIAASVGCRPATLHFTLAHAHLYEPHWPAVKACLGKLGSSDWYDLERAGTKADYQKASERWPSDCEPNLPGWTIDQVLADPDGYCATVGRLAKRVSSLAWDPCPVVVE